MKKLLLATTNPGKFLEIKAGLSDLPFQLLFLPDLEIKTDFEEIGETYEANALAKARHFFNLTGITTLADDSGIEIESLKGEMGVKTRRWGAGEKTSDEDWIDYFLKRMSAFTLPEERRAKFVCVLALVSKNHHPLAPSSPEEGEFLFRGESSGVITPNLQAPIKSGVPLSSCFLPDGCDKVYSALSEEEKGRISHRGRALKKLKQHLERFCFMED